MKKKKFVKSELSARERKEMRRAEEERALSRDGRTESERAERAERGKSRLIALVAIAVIIIAVGITVPVAMSCNYMFEKNPIAVFSFESGGKTYKVEYEIMITDCPNAANNFLFLASTGFFDGTIVYDTQNSQVRIGGYDGVTYGDDGTPSYTHRSDDLDFANGLKSDFSPERYKDPDDPTIFKYRLNKDDNNLTYSMFDYALCSNYSGSDASSTEFQFVCDKNGMVDALSVAGSGNKTFKLEPFAVPKDKAQAEQTFSYILGLDTYKNENGDTVYARKYFSAPAQTVTLKSVKVYNYDDAWNDRRYEYGFESFMAESGAITSTWTKEYI